MTNWNNYWRDKSIKRKLIELARDKYFSKVFTDIIKKHIEPPAKILEAGCGSGMYLKKLTEMGFDCHGLDNSKESVKVAKKNCKNVKLGSLFDIPYKDKEFDLCFNQGVLEHFSDNKIHKAIREMKRVAHSVLIFVPGSRSVFRIYNPWKDSRFFKKKELKKIMSEHYIYSEAEHLSSTGYLTVYGYGMD